MSQERAEGGRRNELRELVLVGVLLALLALTLI